MISVPNHRQLLSGSKLILLLFSVLILASGCELFKKAQDAPSTRDKKDDELESLQSPLVFDPIRNEWVRVSAETPTEKMDTIQWTLVAAEQYPPITSIPLSGSDISSGNPNIGLIDRDNFGSERKSSYNVVLMLPFLANQFDAISDQFSNISKWTLNYYGGTQMALKKLEQEGLNLKINVLDSKGTENEVNQILQNNQAIKNADLIIGPYRRDNIRMVAEFSKRNNITMISPYSASANLTDDNPYYLQVSPSLEAHCRAIIFNARKKFSPEQIVILYQDTPAKLQTVQYFQDANKLYSEDPLAAPLTEMSFPANELPSVEDLDLSSILGDKDSVAIIIPAWSSSDQNFVYTLMSQIDLDRDPFQYLELYGLPQWQQYDRIDLDYFEKLNVHISSNAFLDETSNQIKEFRRDFYDQYGVIAPFEAYLGYDIMLFSGRMMQKYGNKFQYHLEKEMPQYLHTKFEFERVVDPSATPGTENLPIEQFENKFVNILQFKNYRFQKVN